VADGSAGVIGDQAWAGRAVEVGVPGSGQVTGFLSVEVAHQRVDVAVGAVVLADFAGDEGNLGDHRRDLAGPARLRATGVEVVRVPGGGQVAVRVSGPVGQPLAQVVGVRQAAE